MADGHHHGHAPKIGEGIGVAVPASTGSGRWSPLLAGLPTRLALAAALIAGLWAVVIWSLQP